MGYWSFFENFIQIACMLFAWALVLLAFFILAIQLFVTLIEFKLTTLAGFVLIPFGLFGKSAFMAERVLGNVISSGIKVLVLAVIIGIGSTLFSEFTAGFGGATPSIDDAMAIVLAALSLLGLGIFGPGIANGLVSGGPQLGAGAAIGTGLAAGGAVAAGAAPRRRVSGGAALAGGAAAAARGGALAGGASTAYSLGAAGQSGASAVASGLGNVASTGAQAAVSPLKRAAGRAADSLKQSYQSGARSAFAVTGGASTAGTIGGEAEAASQTLPPPTGRRPGRSA
jgi:type IV secretion system protein TrbL